MSGDHNMYGDGNVYRGQRSKDSETKTMTDQELIAKLTEMLEIQQKLQETAVDMIKPAIEAAVLKEREACAQVLDEMAAKDKLSNYYKVAALAIRERGAP